MKKTRDYSNLRETERVFDAVKLNSTYFKDYSLEHICTTQWRLDKEQSYQRLIHINIDREKWIGRGRPILDFVNLLADESDENGWFPRRASRFTGEKGTLTISTQEVNSECLKDHVAKVTIGENTALVDLEELLKATRYA